MKDKDLKALTLTPGKIAICRSLSKLLRLMKGDQVIFFVHEGNLYATRDDYALLPAETLKTALRTIAIIPSNPRHSKNNYRVTMTNTLPRAVKSGIDVINSLDVTEKLMITCDGDAVLVLGVEAVRLTVAIEKKMNE